MKKLSSLLLCLMLLPALLVSARTAPVVDEAGLLSSQEVASLTAMAENLKNQYDLEVAIVTASTVGGKTPEAYADDFFEANYGENGVLLLIDMGSRSWHISTDGRAIDLLPDDDLIFLEEMVIPWIADGLYYEGFEVYLDCLPDLLEPEEEGGFGAFLLIAAIPGALLAAIILAIMAGTMNTRSKQHSASDYTAEGSYRLRTQQDLFLYSNITKRARPKDPPKSGSTTHTSSSGRSHGGRGGKF